VDSATGRGVGFVAVGRGFGDRVGGMATHYRSARDHLARLFAGKTAEELAARLRPDLETPYRPLGAGGKITGARVAARWTETGRADLAPPLLDEATRAGMEGFERNIENFAGTVKVPVGLAGPLRVRGTAAQGDYIVPLATTEAALVASYHRGARVISEAGGCVAITLDSGIGRAPGFVFASAVEAATFCVWALGRVEALRSIAEATTAHGRLSDLRVTMEGNHVYLHFTFTTGDAAGQNMVTLAVESVCRELVESAPVRPVRSYIEANLSGDKKASAQSFLGVRGRKVTAEVVLGPDLLRRRLHVTAEQMADYWRISAMGGVLSGTLGVQGHFANGLAALSIATGNDAACVAESAVGTTRFEVRPGGALYATVTLPNLVLGTVGGGTGLPSQKACLELMGLAGAGKAQALAEVAAGLALAGELSIIAALASGEFARAHRRRARGKRTHA